MRISTTAAALSVAVTALGSGAGPAEAQPADLGRQGTPSPPLGHAVLKYVDVPTPGCVICALPVAHTYQTQMFTDVEIQYYWPNAQYDPWWTFRDHIYYTLHGGNGPVMSGWSMRLNTWVDHHELNAWVSTQHPVEGDDCLTPGMDVTICAQSAFYKETYTSPRYVEIGFTYALDASVRWIDSGFDEWTVLA